MALIITAPKPLLELITLCVSLPAPGNVTHLTHQRLIVGRPGHIAVSGPSVARGKSVFCMAGTLCPTVWLLRVILY